jgi:hypothetical protein
VLGLIFVFRAVRVADSDQQSQGKVQNVMDSRHVPSVLKALVLILFATSAFAQTKLVEWPPKIRIEHVGARDTTPTRL